MPLDKKHIEELISKGETATVEFKLNLPPDRVVANLLSAFANTSGGVLLIGIQDNGVINGLSDNEIQTTIDRLRKITQSFFDYTVPIEVIEINGKKILAVEIAKNPSDKLPIVTSKGEMFIREGNETKRAISLIMARNLAHNIGSHILRGEIKQDSDEFPKRKSREAKIFVAMSFREEEEPALVDYYRAMERAVISTKLPIIINRIDLIEGDYEISQHLMEEIDNSDIVIADFTLSPANVYFELGYARGKSKRIIQLARHDTNLEFDARNWRTIFYRNATELETKLKPAIEAAYKQVIRHYKNDQPPTSVQRKEG